MLIITYYWPPAGGSGVQRWLKFAKYLRSFGWEPIVYTAKNPEAPVVDNSLEKDVPEDLNVIKTRVIEPHRLFRFFTRSNSNMGAGFASSDGEKSGWLHGLSVWIRGNLFIPDARMLWIKPSVRTLKAYIKNNQVDIIISTGPPHSTHLIALGLKRKLKIPWIADFRDPWTNIDYFNDLMLTPYSKNKHQKLEGNVIKAADSVIVVSQQMKEEFKTYRETDIHVITNGFDEDDFPQVPKSLDKDFSITHVGSLPPNRNSTALWKAISNLVETNHNFASKLSIQLVGKVDSSVLADLESHGLKEYCKLYGYVQHKRGVEIMQSSQILLLLINQSPNAGGILTGKVFEYLAAKRPILALGPKGGEMENLISETRSGVFAQFDNEQDIKSKIEWLWSDFDSGYPSFSASSFQKYSRKNLTQNLTRLMDAIALSG